MWFIVLARTASPNKATAIVSLGIPVAALTED